MDDPRTDFFFDQLTGLLDASGQPAAVMDHDFRLVWCSAAGSREMPALALPDGAQLLLHGYDPEVVRAEIDRCGSFTTAGPNHLFAERPTVICALPDGSGRYLIQPVSGAEQGSGMRPEGMSRTLSSFGNQYRAPLTVIFSMLTLLSRNCGPGSSEKDRERMPDYLAAINQSAFRLLRSSEWISDYTRLTYGFSPVRTRRVDLFHYLRELFSAAADLIEPTGIPLSADIPGGMLPAACDTQKVSAALLNILSNSCRYTRPGNQIAVRVRFKRGMLSVSVAVLLLRPRGAALLGQRPRPDDRPRFHRRHRRHHRAHLHAREGNHRRVHPARGGRRERAARRFLRGRRLPLRPLFPPARRTQRQHRLPALKGPPSGGPFPFAVRPPGGPRAAKTFHSPCSFYPIRGILYHYIDDTKLMQGGSTS